MDRVLELLKDLKFESPDEILGNLSLAMRGNPNAGWSKKRWLIVAVILSIFGIVVYGYVVPLWTAISERLNPGFASQPVATTPDCEIVNGRYQLPCNYTTRPGDNLYLISELFYNTPDKWQFICNTNKAFLDQEFRRLSAATRKKYDSYCRFVAPGWELYLAKADS